MQDRNRIQVRDKDFSLSLKYYSHQEIISAQKNYIPVYLSDRLPDYSVYTKEKRISLLRHPKKLNCFEGIEYLFRIFKDQGSENTHFLILGSAGIGKSTFLLNLYSYCIENLGNLNIELFPLRCDNIENEISKIKYPPEDTILLLDGFDEITNAGEDYFNVILNLTKGFRYVVISSRLEFFQNELKENLFTPIVKYSGDKNNYSIKKLFITPFSKGDIKQYLKQSFEIKHKYRIVRFWYKIIFFIFGNPDIIESELLLNRVRFASLRPLFLYYITDLRKGDIDGYNYDFELYEELIYKWIQRESYDVEDKEEFNQKIILILTNIALELERKGNGYLENSEVEIISSSLYNRFYNIVLKAKSLLIRNNMNQYYFFHSSIKEYLLAVKMFNEIKENIPVGFKAKEQYSLFHFLRDEMLLKYILSEKNILSGYASYRDDYLSAFPIKDISSAYIANQIKYLRIIECKIPLSFIALFPNLEFLRFEKIKKEDLRSLCSLKKLIALDISDNKEVVDISILREIKSLKNLKVNNTIVNISTILPIANITNIIISESQISPDIIQKFPEKMFTKYDSKKDLKKHVNYILNLFGVVWLKIISLIKLK